jgi:hypothetical protein
VLRFRKLRRGSFLAVSAATTPPATLFNSRSWCGRRRATLDRAYTNAGGGLRRPSFRTAQTVSAVPHWGLALQVPALWAPAATRHRSNWREEQVVVPTGLRPL